MRALRWIAEFLVALGTDLAVPVLGGALIVGLALACKSCAS